eukprot:COSAG02_NODE_2505_length_8656_cov_6.225950_2_plen_117_part_00
MNFPGCTVYFAVTCRRAHTHVLMGRSIKSSEKTGLPVSAVQARNNSAKYGRKWDNVTLTPYYNFVDHCKNFDSDARRLLLGIGCVMSCGNKLPKRPLVILSEPQTLPATWKFPRVL